MVQAIAEGSRCRSSSRTRHSSPPPCVTCANTEDNSLTSPSVNVPSQHGTQGPHSRLPLDVKKKGGYFTSLKHSFYSHLLLPTHSHLSFSLPPVGSREGQPDSQGICPSWGHPCGGLGCPEPSTGLDKRLLVSAALPGARGSWPPAASPLSTNTNTYTVLESFLAPSWQGHGDVQDVSNSKVTAQSSYGFGKLRCVIKHCAACVIPSHQQQQPPKDRRLDWLSFASAF